MVKRSIALSLSKAAKIAILCGVAAIIAGIVIAVCFKSSASHPREEGAIVSVEPAEVRDVNILWRICWAYPSPAVCRGACEGRGLSSENAFQRGIIH